jgi:hypothetical protein
LELFSEFAGLVFALLFVILLLVFIALGIKQQYRPSREIPAFLRLRRAVGSAVESGTRLHVSLGRADLTGPDSASGLAGLTALERATRAAAISDRPPLATSGEGSLAMLSQETLDAMRSSVSAEQISDPNAGRLTGVTPFSYAAGVMPVIHDEHISTNILLGHFGPEVALITEAAERVGSLTIAGTDQVSAQAVIYATAQEPLVGEEVYASGAYLGALPAHVASLRVQDIFRWVLIIVILLGALARLVRWI